MPPNNRQTNPRTWSAHEVQLDRIRDNPSPVRAIDAHAVASLKESLEVIGQQAPIVLTTDYVLVSGRQRVAAQRARGESTIAAVFIDLPEVLTRMATLDENLCRLELTALQRAELLAERKALYEQVNPDSRHGRAKREGPAPGFTRSMAELTGRGRSTVAEDCVIGGMPESVRALIRGTQLEHRKGTMLGLARLPDEALQLKTCRALLDRSATPSATALREPAQGTGPGDLGKGSGSTGSGSEGGADGTTPAEVSVVALVDSALEPLEDWLGEAQRAPEVENRFIASAVALSNYAAALLERAASGIEAAAEPSIYSRHVRRSARVLSQGARRMTDELLLVTECTCVVGCAECGSARGFAGVNLRNRTSKAVASLEIRDPDLSDDTQQQR